MGVDVLMVCVMSVFFVLERVGIIAKETLQEIIFFDGDINDTFFIMMLLVSLIIKLLLCHKGHNNLYIKQVKLHILFVVS